ncbi:protein kinase ALK2 [Sugiyamaella lignohabitans]|uniref:non-specific serine/threonine protein kinase n=1 Tax=Sugiyamaella lignohabitans TaxID=796027 RepID=A0A161HG02_9ASCO|nr:protein kinase ALK2 [Sugiyamaella lignohabitans]ANB14580.1 protein kinase ALK2 [Sugiyamaella lignohabitans]
MDTAVETKQRKKLFGHNRSGSLFQSFSSTTSKTYGKKKANPTLAKAQAGFQQWSQIRAADASNANIINNSQASGPGPVLASGDDLEDDDADIQNDSRKEVHATTAPIGLGIDSLIPLEIDTSNKENISWEAETTEVLRKIRPTSKSSLRGINVNGVNPGGAGSVTGSATTSATASINGEIAEDSPKQNRLSRLVRTISGLSTTSTSSKDTIDGTKLNRNSTATVSRVSHRSSLSTIHRFSIGSTSSSTDATPVKPQSNRYSALLDVGNLRRSSVANNLSQILNNSDLDTDEEDEEDDMDEGTGKRAIPGIVVPFENDLEGSKKNRESWNDNYSKQRTRPSSEYRDVSHDVGLLNIPSNYPPMASSNRMSYMSLRKPAPPALTISSTSPQSSTVTSPALSHYSNVSIPSISSGSGHSPLLSYKKETGSIKHKRVTKDSISGPTSLVNHQEFFAPRPSFESDFDSYSNGRSASQPANTISGGPSSISTSVSSTGTSNSSASRTSRYGSSFLTSITPHSSLLSLRSTKAKERSGTSTSDFVPNKSPTSAASISSSINLPASSSNTTAKSSTKSKHAHKLSLVNGFTKKPSIQDMKRYISFSPSSSSLFRNASNSPTNGSATMTKSPSILGDSFDKTMISLPIPVDGSREKLRNKLRASTSLLSLARSDTSGSLTVGIPIAEYEQSQLQTLLSLCSCAEIEDFSDYIDHGYDNLEKLAEASFSEVFIQRSSNSSRILKIIPFGNEELDQLPVQDIIQELTIARMLMPLDGYVDVLDSTIVRGTYPQRLLELWDDYDQQKRSENYRPDFFKHDQMYCIVVMANAGTDLEHFDLSSWQDAESIFWQVVQSLALAEEKFEFEHRDLHWGNVVIEEVSKGVSQTTDLLNNLSLEDEQRNTSKRTNPKDKYGFRYDEDEADGEIDDDLYEEKELKVTLIDYTLSRAMTDDGTVVFTRLDHPDFFRGKGDYQFDIYRFMRTFIGGASASYLSPNPANHATQLASTSPGLGHPSPDLAKLNQQTNWSLFCPRTNILWLHYLVDKLLNAKSLPRVSTTRSGRLSFGGGSNGSLRDAYLKGNNVSHNDEARACAALEIIHKTLDPRKKRFGGKKHNSPMSFQDFSSARDVLRWGVRNKYVS